MVRIPVRKRDDGRFEAEGVIFDTGAIGGRTVDAIFSAIFKRLPPAASKQEADERQFCWDGCPQFLHLKTCDDCGALYLDARSNGHRAWKNKRRCRKCFARRRYRYVQNWRARQPHKRKLVAFCAHCGARMTGRSDRKFCSGKCRTAAHRRSRLYQDENL